MTEESRTTGDEVSDSPRGWVAKHMADYLATDGEKGHRWRGTDTLLLTTRGRKTGKLRRTALIYGKDGDRFVIVASNGGSRGQPEWYLNLDADPEVRLQVMADQIEATARTVEGEERHRLWRMMTAIWPDYDNYQEKTTRLIPVVVLEPHR